MTNTWLAGDADRDHLMPSTPLFFGRPATKGLDEHGPSILSARIVY